MVVVVLDVVVVLCGAADNAEDDAEDGAAGDAAGDAEDDAVRVPDPAFQWDCGEDTDDVADVADAAAVGDDSDGDGPTWYSD